MSPSPSPVPLAARLAKLPPYLFAEIDKQKREARARGVDLIDMGIGDPDLPTPPHIIEAIKRSAETPANHRYPDYEGLLSFRTAVADWYRKRFGVTLDPQTEVLTLIGSKEGTAHMPLAFVNPGDVVLVPDPGYPVYAAGTWFAGGEVHWMPLKRANGFLPDTISSDVHQLCINGPAFDQVTTMSKFLCLGMELPDVIAASTVNAGMALKRPELGSLKPGSVGDATVLKIQESRFDYVDVVGEHLEGDRKIASVGVVVGGRWWHPKPE